MTTTALRAYRASQRRRALLVVGSMATLAVAGFTAIIMFGSSMLSISEVLASLAGWHSNPATDFIVHTLRLPHALAALCTGLALGLSGTIFQQVLRNPLAAPDFVGVSAGASLAVVSGIVFWHLNSIRLAGVALIGALVSAWVIYALAWRGGVSGYRFILVGIGVSEFFFAFVYYVIARAQFSDARKAWTWLVGSVGQSDTKVLGWLVACLLILGPLAIVLYRQLRTLELGDDSARALGLRVEHARFALLLIAVTLSAFATAVAGPLAFVALVAGPIARSLLGPSTAALVAAMLCGAIVVLAADLAARFLLPYPLPTGVLTGAIGAPYLLWLLATTNRKGQGG